MSFASVIIILAVLCLLPLWIKCLLDLSSNPLIRVLGSYFQDPYVIPVVRTSQCNSNFLSPNSHSYLMETHCRLTNLYFHRTMGCRLKFSRVSCRPLVPFLYLVVISKWWTIVAFYPISPLWIKSLKLTTSLLRTRWLGGATKATITISHLNYLQTTLSS